jgi:VanZ family protein
VSPLPLTENPAMTRAQRLRGVVPLLLMAALLLISSLPGTEDQAPALMERLTPSWQNALHVPAYGVLTLSWFWALFPVMDSSRRAASLAGAISLLFALLDEYNQSTVPGRTGSLTDVALDTLGILLALVIILIWRKLRD